MFRPKARQKTNVEAYLQVVRRYEIYSRWPALCLKIFAAHVENAHLVSKSATATMSLRWNTAEKSANTFQSFWPPLLSKLGWQEPDSKPRANDATGKRLPHHSIGLEHAWIGAKGVYPWVLRRKSHIAVVGMSAYPEDEFEAKDLGVTHWVSKPFNLQTLSRVLSSAHSATAADGSLQECSTSSNEIGRNSVQRQAQLFSADTSSGRRASPPPRAATASSEVQR